MVGAILRRLPLVAGAHQPPLAELVVGGRLLGVLGAQFVGGELATQADVVGDADRLVEALGPDGDDLVDRRPGADGFDPDLLVLVKLSLGHWSAFCCAIRGERLAENACA
jgi:hypothetical protein